MGYCVYTEEASARISLVFFNLALAGKFVPEGLLVWKQQKCHLSMNWYCCGEEPSVYFQDLPPLLLVNTLEM